MRGMRRKATDERRVGMMKKSNEQKRKSKKKHKLFWGKVFATKYDLVIAICDEELIDKKFEYKNTKVKIKISKNFYGEQIIDEQTAVRLMRRATIGNLMGKRIVNLAKKNDFITKENIISIGGIPHAQFVKI